MLLTTNDLRGSLGAADLRDAGYLLLVPTSRDCAHQSCLVAPKTAGSWLVHRPPPNRNDLGRCFAVLRPGPLAAHHPSGMGSCCHCCGSGNLAASSSMAVTVAVLRLASTVSSSVISVLTVLLLRTFLSAVLFETGNPDQSSSMGVGIWWSWSLESSLVDPRGVKKGQIGALNWSLYSLMQREIFSLCIRTKLYQFRS